MRLYEINLYRVDLPLTAPYRLSYRTFESFEPLIVEVRDEAGGIGWGEQHISPGSSAETREGGWAFARELAEAILGLDGAQAKRRIAARAGDSKVAATALTTAIEMLEGAPLLRSTSERRLRLLTAFNASDREAIAEEVERRLAEGYRTFKVKVGKDVDADIKRLARIQECLAGRATLRIDANRAYGREQGCRFASSISPGGVELFEQPCAAEDWQANAAVAAVSRVPLMLDEPICALADIDRAAGIPGVGLCKVKLKRFGSLAGLREAVQRVRGKSMGVVLGDGLGAEINCWMEACIADGLVNSAGEFNGFLKIRPEARLLARPLHFEAGEIVLPAQWWPEMDRKRLAERSLHTERFAAIMVNGGRRRRTDLTGKEKRMDIIATGAALGAEVEGVDLSKPLDAETLDRIRTAWDEHLVLVFRGQQMSDPDLLAFSRHFGELDPPGPNPYGTTFLPDYPEINVISNLKDAENRPIGNLGAGEAVWHADMTYIDSPPKAAILFALEVPEGQGDTYFANMVAAYEDLPDDLKGAIKGKRAIHDAAHNSAGMLRMGYEEVTDPRQTPGVRHPLVYRDPLTGRRALFLGRRPHAYIIGMDPAGSEALLDRIWAHATQAKYAWVHKWRTGDLLMWQNLWVLHRRDGFEADARRVLHRTQIKGDQAIAG